MNFSAIFIYRPVATTLLTIALALAGAIAFFQLPVAPLPQVDFPTISLMANLPGASPETMAATVATPLERALGRIAGITEMTSASSLGSTTITLQFDLNRDIDGAARDVQAAINAASSLLPINMPSRPSYRKVNPADSPILVLALTSDTLSRGQMYDAATTILAQKIAEIPGMGQVSVGGSSLPAVRIDINPNALAHYGLALEDVRKAIVSGNVNSPKGALDNAAQHWQIHANDQAVSVEDYLPIIVAYKQGSPTRISDIALVHQSVEDIRNAGIKDGKPAVLLILNKQPGANIIETVESVKALLPQLQAMIPAAIDLSIVIDRSLTIRASVLEVERSLGLAILLVMLVVLVFLRKWRSALIPVIAVPVSLIGSCSVMYLCGYSIDNLSLMALTIATGFVVDDAIVVLENISRHIEKGSTPFAAALAGAKEVGFTVLSMSLSLIAVFLPILLMGGIVGRLFREFAVTLSTAVLVSLLVSLTVTPMLCARWLVKAEPQKSSGGLSRLLEIGFQKLQTGYEISLAGALKKAPYMLLVFLICIGLNVYLYSIVPKGFFPVQDNGRLFGTIQADQSISFQSMEIKLQEFGQMLKSDPDILSVVGFAGGGQNTNMGRMFAVLKPPSERNSTIGEINQRLRKQLSKEPGASLFLQPVQDLRIGGRLSPAMFEFTLQAEHLADLREWTPKLVRALSQLPQLSDVNTDQQDKGQQISLVVDRQKAAQFGINQGSVDATLNDAFGQRQVSVIYQPLNQYHVVMELDPKYWQDPQILKQIYIPSTPTLLQPNTKQIPLANVAEFKPTNTPLTVNHQSQFPAATVSFNLKTGTALSDATALIQKTMLDIGVPQSVHGSFQGSAKAFQQSLQNQPWLILAALLTIYVVLGILYESYIHPLTIISTLPSAGVGAILALMLCDTEFSIIALIGVILLIGIVKKNAIMMIDCALHVQREQMFSPEAAIYNACIQRFRPIMMTTLAALLGALPLAMGTGYGAELRKPLGISIVGGLMFSQLLTLYTTPVVYLYLDKMSNWFLRQGKRSKKGAA